MKWVKIYTGEFQDLAREERHLWTVDITRRVEDTAPAPDTIGVLTFEKSPLVFEWGRAEKHDVFAPCRCTLSIESPGDRTYVGLYSIAPGEVKMNVCCDGKLFWSGLLDPEFYEEPYAYASRYAVKLTFTDFGIMKRQKFNLSGIVDIAGTIRAALDAAGLDLRVDTRYVSSIDSAGNVIDLGRICVQSSNFYDEEGEAMTWREVIEGMLRPLGLRIVQRGGAVYVHDLNGLYAGAPQVPVVWSAKDQTLKADKVFNSVRLTFSPYNSATLIDGKIEHKGLLSDTTPKSFLTQAWWDTGYNAMPAGFDICHGSAAAAGGKQPLTLSNGAEFFRIDAHASGADCSGVAWRGSIAATRKAP